MLLLPTATTLQAMMAPDPWSRYCFGAMSVDRRLHRRNRLAPTGCTWRGREAFGGVGKPVATILLAIALWAAGAIEGVRAAQPGVVSVANGVYALLGTGGDITPENGGRVANVAFIVGPRGIVVVDTGASSRQGDEILAAVRSVSARPIRLVILTHPGQEAIFGATAFQARGIPVASHRKAAELISVRCETCLRNLGSVLGEDAMAATRVPTPDRLIEASETLGLIGRPLRLTVSGWSSTPGAISVFDERTSTLIAGSEVAIDRIPDLRDANPQGWRNALARIAALKCRHLVPGYGPIGTCADAGALAHYLAELERGVEALMREGVSLGELRDRCGLPEFARWDQYETLHPENANRTYLRLERLQFK